MSKGSSNVPDVKAQITVATNSSYATMISSYGEGGIRGDDMFTKPTPSVKAEATGSGEVSRQQSYGADGICGPKF